MRTWLVDIDQHPHDDVKWLQLKNNLGPVWGSDNPLSKGDKLTPLILFGI